LETRTATHNLARPFGAALGVYLKFDYRLDPIDESAAYLYAHMFGRSGSTFVANLGIFTLIMTRILGQLYSVRL